MCSRFRDRGKLAGYPCVLWRLVEDQVPLHNYPDLGAGLVVGAEPSPFGSWPVHMKHGAEGLFLYVSPVAGVGAGETQRWFQFVIALSYVTFSFPSKCQSHKPQANTRGRSSSLELDFISWHPLFCITSRASASLIKPWPTQSLQCSYS